MSSLSRSTRARRRPTAALAALLALALLLPSAGVATAAPATGGTCTESEGTNYCYLAITAPTDVVAGSTFTVTVAIYNLVGVLASNDRCAAKLPVTLSIYDSGYSVASITVPWTATKNASGAVASFSIPGLPGGYYSLMATYEGTMNDSCGNYYYDSTWLYDGAWDLYSFEIPPTDSIAPCPPGTVCTQTTSETGSAATLVAVDGTFTDVYWDDTAGAEVPPVGGCTIPVDTVNGVLTFTSSATTSKSAIFALAPYLVKRGVSTYNLCWTAPFPFITKSKQYAIYHQDRFGNGWYTGLLRDCKAGDPGPCIAFRKSNKKNAVFVGVVAPVVGPLDPKGYVN